MVDKIALVGDLHLGPRCETTAIRDRVIDGQKAFLSSMIDNIVASGIRTVVFLGDIFTTRSTLGIDTISYAMELFGKMDGLGLDVHIICGNHDLMYDDVDEVSSLCILERFSNVHVYRRTVSKVNLLGKTWYMVPWIVPSRMPSVVEWLEKLGKGGNRDNTVIAGHFDMCGMLMEAGQISTFGLEPELFAAAAGNVFSGHYHCRSSKVIDGSTVNYLGSPYHLSFAHVGTDCGYYTLDSDMNLEFIENVISPRFTECDDEHLDSLPDLGNSFVRYYTLSSRNFDDALERKKKVLSAHPLHIKPIPYGGDNGTIEDVKHIDDEEARHIMSADSLDIAEMYMDKFPDELPKFATCDDSKAKIIELLKGIDAKVK